MTETYLSVARVWRILTTELDTGRGAFGVGLGTQAASLLEAPGHDEVDGVPERYVEVGGAHEVAVAVREWAGAGCADLGVVDPVFHGQSISGLRTWKSRWSCHFPAILR